MYKKKLCDMNHTTHTECRMAGGHYFVVQAISTWLKQTTCIHSYHWPVFCCHLTFQRHEILNEKVKKIFLHFIGILINTHCLLTLTMIVGASWWRLSERTWFVFCLFNYPRFHDRFISCFKEICLHNDNVHTVDHKRYISLDKFIIWHGSMSCGNYDVIHEVKEWSIVH